MKTKVIKTSGEHEATYQELCQIVSRHAAKLTAMEVLAIAANMVGKLLALQDQRTTTSEMAMKVVAENIEAGNKQVIDQLMQSKGRA
jgi:uncharacterized membrane protein